MNLPTLPPQPAPLRLPLTKETRLCYLGVASLLAMTLGVALYLSPSAEGHGTHRQLGLPACSMYALTNIRCPACGMTTAWSHTVRGEFAQAIRTNLGGMILCWQAMFAVPVLVGIAWRGTGSHRNWFLQLNTSMVIAVVVVATAQWIGRFVTG
jgi:hypothetical protein